MTPLSQIDISKLKVLEYREWGWIRHTLFELERTEMPSKVKLVTLIVTEENGQGVSGYLRQLQTGVTQPTQPAQWRETNRRKSISIRKKYLCIGGGLDGKLSTKVDAGGNYALYIRHVAGRKQRIPSGVLIDKSWIGVRSGLEW